MNDYHVTWDSSGTLSIVVRASNPRTAIWRAKAAYPGIRMKGARAEVR